MNTLTDLDIRKAKSIRSARAIGGVSINELAHYLGVQRQSFLNYEKERISISTKCYKRIIDGIRTLIRSL